MPSKTVWFLKGGPLGIKSHTCTFVKFLPWSSVFKASFMCAICTRGAAPGVCFLPCERCFKNLQIRSVQIYLHPCANLHPGANCAHELYNFYTVLREISINDKHFLLRCCLKSIRNKFKVVFYRNENHVYYFDHSSTRYLNLCGYRRSHPPTPTFLKPNSSCGISIGSMSALYANSPNIEPRVCLSWIFPLLLI